MSKKQVGLLVAIIMLCLCVFSCLGVMILGEVQGDKYQAPLPVVTPIPEPTITPWVLPTKVVVPTIPHCICDYNAYNCGDPEAVECFTTCGSDIHGLDADGDGVPCEQ